MHNLRSLLAMLFTVLPASLLLAQNELDAFRYAQNTVTGTARSIAVGGAFSAVGADFTSTYLNPAGLAFYRRSDFMFTPTFKVINNDATFLDGSGTAARANFGFANLGYVYADNIYITEDRKRVPAKSGFKSWAISVGMNQIANYYRETTVEGFNDQNSITRSFANMANGTHYSDVEASINTLPGLAWYTYMIDTIPGTSDQYYPAANGGQVQQRFTQVESGRNNEWAVGVGGNFDDFLYVGATLGIQDIFYESSFLYTEDDINNVHNSYVPGDSLDFNSLEYYDQLRTRGIGINGKFGLIIRPADYIRFGISVQSPTFTSLNEDYSRQMYSTFDNAQQYEQASDPGKFSYNLTTPYKLTTGVMVMIKKYGFLTADFDITDYSTMRFSSQDAPNSQFYYNFASENQAIRDLFDFSYNLRVGGEFRYEVFRFRAGYAHYGSVLSDDAQATVNFNTGVPVKYDGGRNVITGGIGFKKENYYIDLAYARDVMEQHQLMYSVDESQGVSPEILSKRFSNSFYMTVGFTF